ncbi:MAG: HEAT repeat domain-containing protein, partial [Candidatus Marinimicrobia bacterium]|nr:HEAT repeat domain-containing protein [Candidatus Neomarinimicrobiota bacterium]
GFSNQRSRLHYSRVRTYDVQHIKLELNIDQDAGIVVGTSSITFIPINDGFSQLVLDAAEMEIASVALAPDVSTGKASRPGRRKLEFKHQEDRLIIDLDRPYDRDETITVAVAYQVQPKMGLYFVRPDEAYPDKPNQVWSQGEQEEHHYWFPCYDFPNDLATSEMIVTVAAGQLAISNGELLETKENPAEGTVTYHWRENVPHVTYLISLVVGDFTEVRDEWRGIPVLYYVDPRDKDLVERSFGRTTDMMEYYSTVIGIDYPYEKYAQTTITDFMWGGMENVSATTMTNNTLHDEIAHMDFSSDGLVAHELVHQWWGDLLTTKNWNHLWLNEAFATYFDALWVEHDQGRREFLMKMEGNKERYLKEDREDYRRPIVTNRYEDPTEMFDRHTYQKGALVLHMIRYQLGDELWWQAIKHYGRTHAGQAVETNDFRQAIEDATGRPMELFFDQWIFRGGHPQYEVSWKWDRKRSAVALKVKQTQQVDQVTPLFRMPVQVAVTGESGTETFSIEVNRAEEVFYLELAAKPARVAFDPEDWILKELTFDKSKKELLDQLANGGDVERRRAAEWLSKYNRKAVAVAIGVALREDPFRSVREQAAKSLGKIRTKAARDELLRGLQDPDSRVRQKVVTALGDYKGDEQVASALVEQFTSDASYYVRANVVTALANMRSKRVGEIIDAALETDSFREIIRDSAMTALAKLKEPAGIDLAMEWAEYGRPLQVRRRAIRTLGKLGRLAPKRNDQVRNLLVGYLQDPHFRARNEAMKALGDLGDDQAIAALEAAIDREYLFRSKDAGRDAITKLNRK